MQVHQNKNHASSYPLKNRGYHPAFLVRPVCEQVLLFVFCLVFCVSRVCPVRQSFFCICQLVCAPFFKSFFMVCFLVFFVRSEARSAQTNKHKQGVALSLSPSLVVYLHVSALES